MVSKGERKTRKARITTLAILFALSLTTFSGVAPTATAVPDEVCVGDTETCFEILANIETAAWTWTASQGPHVDVVDVTLGICPEGAGLCLVNVDSQVSPSSEFGANCHRDSVNEPWDGSVNVWGGGYDCVQATGGSFACVGAASVKGEARANLVASGEGSGVIDCIDE